MSGDGGHERALWIEVRWPDGRFHGVREARTAGREAVVPEWPPSPFRLFQALVAGAYGGRWAGEDGEALAAKDEAFCWLEGLHPPSVSAPAGKPLRPVTYYVPNNDADAVGGDPGRIGEIRSAKELRTSLFDADRPAAYLWRFDAAADDGEGRAQRMAELAGRLHTLGHGIDAAFAHAEVVDAAEGERRQLALGGAPRRPSLRPGGKGEPTPCPAVGSLGSLKARHAAFTGRFARVGSGRRAVTRFSQPPKAHARAVAYERAPTRLLYELRPLEGGKQFRAWPLTEAAGLAVAVRDLAAGLLADAWPGEVERLIFGRGAGPHEKALRLRILPLPSLGSTHTDMGVRRMLVEIPPDHPIPVADIDWALAGREPARADGELTGLVLTPADDQGMLDREYLSTDHKGRPTARVWRTTTPAALPWRGPRGKTPGEARTAAEAQAAAAVVDALRHAGVVTPVTSVRVQREPFQPKGERADAFVLEGDLAARFSKGDLRHVEVTFAEPAAGPLALGNGRWTGLGVMRGEAERKRRRAAGVDGVHVFTVSGADGARGCRPPTRRHPAGVLLRPCARRRADRAGGERAPRAPVLRLRRGRGYGGSAAPAGAGAAPGRSAPRGAESDPRQAPGRAGRRLGRSR